MADTDVRVPFLPQDFGRGDHIIASCLDGRRRRSRRQHSGSCKFPALVFRLRRWKRDRRLVSWLAGGHENVGNTSKSRGVEIIMHRHVPATLLPSGTVVLVSPVSVHAVQSWPQRTTPRPYSKAENSNRGSTRSRTSSARRTSKYEIILKSYVADPSPPSRMGKVW